MFKIDFQCHVFPKEYLKIMEQANAEIIPERDPRTGGLFLFDRKANQRINPVTDKFFDVDTQTAGSGSLRDRSSGSDDPYPWRGPV